MRIRQKYFNLYIACAITGIATLLAILLFYKDTNGMGKWFTLSILYMYARYAFLVIGTLLLLGRVLKLIKRPYALGYILAGVVNIFVALVAVVLYFSTGSDVAWLNACLLNLLVGVLIMADFFLSES
jgi:hypothetical protein